MARLFASASSQSAASGSAPVTAYPFSMGIWFRSSDTTNLQQLLGVGVDGSNNNYWNLFAAGQRPGDPVMFQTRTTSNGDAISTTGYSANTWHHAMGVATSATSRAVFLDGGGKATNGTNLTPSGVDSARLSKRGDGANYLNGRLAEGAVWNTNLSDAEVLALARGVSPLRIRAGNLVAYWPLYGAASPEPDYGGTANNMTLANSPTQADHAPALQLHWGFDLGWQGNFATAAATFRRRIIVSG